ncbi:MAG: site-2 protease family protein, partial [Actinomycetota bacterium]|nr:site-2 protease family protein [Actinomycetota bacterium]
LGVIALSRSGALDGIPDLAFVFLQSFVWAGLVWGILNWIPILPLDGGHMLQHALEMVTPKKAAPIARVISVVTGVAVSAAALYFGETFLAIFVAMITFMGFREGRSDQAKKRPEPEPRVEEPPDAEPPTFPI